MAYLRKEKETYEIAYSLTKVWTAILKVLKDLDWEIEECDDGAHHAKAKTKSGFVSWSSTLLIDADSVNENTARVSVVAETPVTTITAVVNFGRSRERIALFFEALAKQLSS